MNYSLRGLVVELLTPLDAQGRVDREGLSRLVGYCAPLAQALAVAGPQAGQGLLLEPAMWCQAVEEVLAQAPPALPVLVGLTAQDSPATLARARELKTLAAGRPVWGLDLALFHHSNRGLPDWVSALAEAAGAPVGLINHPDLARGRRGVGRHLNLMPEVLAKCARGGGLAGVFALGPLKLTMAYQRALAANGPIPLYDADEESFLVRPSNAGVLSAGAGLLPRDWAALVGQSLRLGTEGPPSADQRGALLASARRARELAGLLANYPAPVLAHLAQGLGLLNSRRTLAPPAEALVIAAAERWAAEELAAAGWPAA